MTQELQNPKGDKQGQPGTENTIKLREDYADVRAGARQEDQLEGLHPGVDPEPENNNSRPGPLPVSRLTNGGRKDHEYPKDQQRWPENKVPTK